MNSDLLMPVNENGVVVIEGPPGRLALGRADDVDRLLEACFAADCGAALLHADNLPEGFFDLRAGIAGAMLQKLRLYGVRLAIIRESGDEPGRSRFDDLVAEERTRRDFAVFGSRAEARAWLSS